MNTNIYELPLEQVLHIAVNNPTAYLNLYACALSKSRNEAPTVNSVRLVDEIVRREGSKWLEVASRMAVNNFQLVFRCANQSPALLPVLLSTVNYSHHFIQLEHLTLSLFHELDQGNQTLWFSLITLIRNHLQLARRKVPLKQSQDHLFAILTLASQKLSKIS